MVMNNSTRKTHSTIDAAEYCHAATGEDEISSVPVAVLDF